MSGTIVMCLSDVYVWGCGLRTVGTYGALVLSLWGTRLRQMSFTIASACVHIYACIYDCIHSILILGYTCLALGDESFTWGISRFTHGTAVPDLWGVIVNEYGYCGRFFGQGRAGCVSTRPGRV